MPIEAERVCVMDNGKLDRGTISQILADSRSSNATSLIRLRMFSMDVSLGHSLTTYSLSKLTLSQLRGLIEDPKARILYRPNWWNSSIVLTGWTSVYLPTQEDKPSLIDQWRSFLKNWKAERIAAKKKIAAAKKKEQSRYRKTQEQEAKKVPQ